MYHSLTPLSLTQAQNGDSDGRRSSSDGDRSLRK